MCPTNTHYVNVNKNHGIFKLIDQAITSLFKPFPQQYRGNIYHYTSVDGIIGIVTKHEIWMSDTAFMNDTTELKRLQDTPPQGIENEYVKKAWETLNVKKPFSGNKQVNHYMASFSKKKDSLEQWRAYGNYCIGFDAKKLNTQKCSFLCSCIYNDKEIIDWINQQGYIVNSSERDRMLMAYILLHVASMKYKDSHFAKEQEVRLIARMSNSHNNGRTKVPVYFRPHPIYRFPIPYFKFAIRNDCKDSRQEDELLPIKEIIIGPMAHRNEAKDSCEKLLTEQGYSGVPVNLSQIPYRGI